MSSTLPMVEQDAVQGIFETSIDTPFGVDSRKLSLVDFADVDGDIMTRAQKFGAFLKDIAYRGHNNFRRVSLSGSGPCMDVLDQNTGKVRSMIYMAANDYLNLTRHPRVVAAGIKAVEKYGAGAGSVPMLGGTFDIHIALEKEVAAFKGCGAAIIYTSGFGSNAGTLLSMLNEKDCAVLDMLVHASLKDGCARTNIEYFRHNNVQSLEKVLAKASKKYRTKLVVVDGVYSMDGDIAPLNQIVEIAHAYGAYVMVDEAHATGVIGAHGKGTPEHCGVEGKVDIVAGTFSKGLGVVGGFIATTPELVELLHFYSRSYFFSTAMAPQAVASLREGLKVIVEEPELRQKLWENIRYFRAGLTAMGYDLGNAETAIFPLIVKDDLKVKEMVKYAHERGLYVNPVVYPAVPRRLARLRCSLMATHTKEHLDTTLGILEDAGKRVGVI